MLATECLWSAVLKNIRFSLFTVTFLFNAFYNRVRSDVDVECAI